LSQNTDEFPGGVECLTSNKLFSFGADPEHDPRVREVFNDTLDGNREMGAVIVKKLRDQLARRRGLRFTSASRHYCTTLCLNVVLAIRLGRQWRNCRKICVGVQGQSGQAIKLFQITPYVNDFQTLNNPGSRQPVGASKKNSFRLPSIFRDKYFIVDDVKLAELSSNSSELKNVTF